MGGVCSGSDQPRVVANNDAPTQKQPAPAPAAAAPPAEQKEQKAPPPAAAPAAAPPAAADTASSGDAAKSGKVDLTFEEAQLGETNDTEAKLEANSDVDDWVDYNRVVNAKNLANPEVVTKDFGLFATEEASTGVQFAAVKPWTGQIYPPSEYAGKTHDSSAPSTKLQVEWVYGYRAADCRNNVAINSQGSIVYPAAAVAVVYDPKRHQQQHFQGHNDDIICLAQAPSNADLIATGQVATIVNRRATLPHICVWDAKSMQTLATLQNAHQRAVRTVGFSASGNLLASVGDDDNYELKIWNWKTGAVLAKQSADTNPNKVFQLVWFDDERFVTVGCKHCYFWEFKNGSLKKRRGIVKKPLENLSAYYSATWTRKGLCAVAGINGEVYIFRDQNGAFESVAKIKVSDGDKAVNCVLGTANGVFTGGKDNKVKFWDNSLKLQQTFNFSAPIKSLAELNGRVIVGIESAELHEIANYTNAAGSPQRLVNGHFDGETWGLDVNPTDPNIFATVGEDNKIVLWDAAKHSVLKQNEVNSKPDRDTRRKREKASTLTVFPSQQCARSIAFHPSGKQVAVGTNEGEVAVYEVSQLNRVTLVNLNKYSKQQVPNKDKLVGNWIQCLKYSPCGNYLAAGTRGSVVVVLNTNDYSPILNSKGDTALNSNLSPVTHLDWSADSKYLRTNDISYELLFYDVDKLNADKAQNTASKSLNDVKWKTETCILTWTVQGIFDPQQDGTDVNCVDRSPDGNLLATGDDYGYVNLFKYPSPVKNASKATFIGHSSHVMNVKFSPDQRFLLTVGGNDKTIIQWRISN